jgi:2,4-diketo-3-deoxy-L-fuconate hydrolase
MKITRFYDDRGILHQGVLIDEVVADVTEFGEDWDEAFFGSNGLARLEQWMRGGQDSLTRHPVCSVRLAPAIARPSKLVCVGLNYADHAKESGAPIPSDPMLFMKSTSAWCGPNDDLQIPKGSSKTDWEVELAVVIGMKAKRVSLSDALNYVAGFAIHMDYSERAWQLEGSGQWVKGKSADTFAPFGPFMATYDELGDIGNLRLWLSVNGEIKQDGATSDLIFRVPELVSYVSSYMTLLPGDVLSTGTPAGVGFGSRPQQFLRQGDVVESGITDLGTQRQLVVNEP